VKGQHASVLDLRMEERRLLKSQGQQSIMQFGNVSDKALNLRIDGKSG
jgi:hypothetical protein